MDDSRVPRVRSFRICCDGALPVVLAQTGLAGTHKSGARANRLVQYLYGAGELTSLYRLPRLSPLVEQIGADTFLEGHLSRIGENP